jgi:hypothetical protein
MKFKYYHGTSSIFLNSIKENGLGKINPNIDYKNLDVLIFLKNIAEENLMQNEGYLKLRDTTIAMANQTFLKLIDEKGNLQTLNYKHDGIYVAITRQRAAIYSSLNKYGSEILERIINIYKLLKEMNIEFQIPEEINLFEIEKYIDCNPEPIIIEIIEIDDSNLEKEDGKTAEEALDFLRIEIPKMSEKTKFEFLQVCNFKIINPIEPKYLKFYKLEFEGHPIDKNFEFTLSKI